MKASLSRAVTDTDTFGSVNWETKVIATLLFLKAYQPNGVYRLFLIYFPVCFFFFADNKRWSMRKLRRRLISLLWLWLWPQMLKFNNIQPESEFESTKSKVSDSLQDRRTEESVKVFGLKCLTSCCNRGRAKNIHTHVHMYYIHIYYISNQVSVSTAVKWHTRRPFSDKYVSFTIENWVIPSAICVIYVNIYTYIQI